MARSLSSGNTVIREYPPPQSIHPEGAGNRKKISSDPNPLFNKHDKLLASINPELAYNQWELLNNSLFIHSSIAKD